MCRQNLRIQRDGNFKASTNSVVVLYRNHLDELESYKLLRTHLFSIQCCKKCSAIHIYLRPQYHAQEKEGRRRKERKEKEDKMHALKDISYASELLQLLALTYTRHEVLQKIVRAWFLFQGEEVHQCQLSEVLQVGYGTMCIGGIQG